MLFKESSKFQQNLVACYIYQLFDSAPFGVQETVKMDDEVVTCQDVDDVPPEAKKLKAEENKPIETEKNVVLLSINQLDVASIPLEREPPASKAEQPPESTQEEEPDKNESSVTINPSSDTAAWSTEADIGSVSDSVEEDNIALLESEGGQVEVFEHPGTWKSRIPRCVRLGCLVLGLAIMPLALLGASLVIGLGGDSSCPPLYSPQVWWKNTVIYQIYPQSFQDSNGDGIGDLRGITSRVAYLNYLGVGAVWLNPIYPSPMADAGYDVSNYTGIHTQYGTMDDFKELLKTLHENGIRLLMDFVPNHTSDKHPWFLESKTSRDSPKRDWYIWADPAEDGGPPNNWLSLFGGSMWMLDNTTNQYYLHQFTHQQPDLNMTNPAVLEEMDKVLEFWFDLGVDGFRMDAVAHLLEDPEMRNESLAPEHAADKEQTYESFVHNRTTNLPGIHSIFRRWRKVADRYSDKLIIGEVYSSVDVVMTYFGSEEQPEFHFPFNFFLLDNETWNGTAVAKVVNKWFEYQPKFGWPNWVLGNHDNVRVATRVGPELARALNVLLLLLPGTPTTYYGEELGLENTDVPKDQQKDKNTDNPRDGERTPMLWDDSKYAGFTDAVTPWLPLPDRDTVETQNVEAQKSDPKSMLHLYKRLVNLRGTGTFTHGSYKQLTVSDDILVFLRYFKEGLKLSPYRFAVAINFSSNHSSVSFSDDDFVDESKIILSSYLDVSSKSVNSQSLQLRPYEAVVLQGQSDFWV